MAKLKNAVKKVTEEVTFRELANNLSGHDYVSQPDVKLTAHITFLRQSSKMHKNSLKNTATQQFCDPEYS